MKISSGKKISLSTVRSLPPPLVISVWVERQVPPRIFRVVGSTPQGRYGTCFLAPEAQSPARPSLVIPGTTCLPPQPRRQPAGSSSCSPGQVGQGLDPDCLPPRLPTLGPYSSEGTLGLPLPLWPTSRPLLLPLLPLGNSLPHLIPFRSSPCSVEGTQRGWGQ